MFQFDILSSSLHSPCSVQISGLKLKPEVEHLSHRTWVKGSVENPKHTLHSPSLLSFVFRVIIMKDESTASTAFSYRGVNFTDLC